MKMARSRSIYESNEELQELFEKYNKEYFQSKMRNVEVKWSGRLTNCAGICNCAGKNSTTISLSTPLLKLRPRRDLINILLHEMIHAYLSVVDGDKENEEHGPKFNRMMDRINQRGSHHITIFHEFDVEVEELRTYWWKCSGKCVDVGPKYGIVKRSIDRPPGPSETWWLEHKKICAGKFVKIRDPNRNVKPSKSNNENKNSNSVNKRKSSLSNYACPMDAAKRRRLNSV